MLSWSVSWWVYQKCSALRFASWRFLPVNLSVLPSVSRVIGVLLQAQKNRIALRRVREDVRSFSTLTRWAASSAPPPDSPSLTKYNVGMLVCVHKSPYKVQKLSSSLCPAYCPHDIASMIDQGLLVPSFLSYLETTCAPDRLHGAKISWRL
jgi:hypothetical protein